VDSAPDGWAVFRSGSTTVQAQPLAARERSVPNARAPRAKSRVRDALVPVGPAGTGAAKSDRRPSSIDRKTKSDPGWAFIGLIDGGRPRSTQTTGPTSRGTTGFVPRRRLLGGLLRGTLCTVLGLGAQQAAAQSCTRSRDCPKGGVCAQPLCRQVSRSVHLQTRARRRRVPGDMLLLEEDRRRRRLRAV
jgi:hypothetical protein